MTSFLMNISCLSDPHLTLAAGWQRVGGTNVVVRLPVGEAGLGATGRAAGGRAASGLRAGPAREQVGGE